MTNKLVVCGSGGRDFMSRMIRVGMKPLVAALVFVRCASCWANEDHLEIAFSRGGGTGHGVWFSSSYGTGSFAVDGRLLFLRCGTGRGTFAREQHVKVFQIGNTDALEELADVKVAAYVEPGTPEKGDPILMEYAVQTTREGTTTTVSFLPPQGVRWPTKVLKIEDGEEKNSP